MKQRDVWRLMEMLACGELGMITSNVRYSQQGSARFLPDCAMYSLLMFSDGVHSESLFIATSPRTPVGWRDSKGDHHGT